jgi:hypothetical protein
LQFSRTLNLCPEIEKLSVVVIEKFEGAIWLKKNHRGVYKIAEQRGPYSVLLLKARMLALSHGDRSKLHNSIQSMRASQWTALNWSCSWVQDIFTPYTCGLFSNFQTLALDDYHIKPPRHEEIEHLQWFRVIGC